MIRVTEVVDYAYPFNNNSFSEWCNGQGLTSHAVSAVSAILGNYYHLKLERGEYDSFLEEYFGEKIKERIAEKTMKHEGLQGTPDLIIILESGKKIMIDAKTWGTWRKHLGAEDKSGDTEEKRKKLRLQFGGYDYLVQNCLDMKIDEFYCLHINGEMNLIKLKAQTKRFVDKLNEYSIYLNLEYICQEI